jgi:hypothetical protein
MWWLIILSKHKILEFYICKLQNTFMTKTLKMMKFMLNHREQSSKHCVSHNKQWKEQHKHLVYSRTHIQIQTLRRMGKDYDNKYYVWHNKFFYTYSFYFLKIKKANISIKLCLYIKPKWRHFVINYFFFVV